MEKLTINASKDYNVIIEKSSIKKAGKLISKVLPAAKKLVVITDDIVDGFYGQISQPLMKSLRASGFDTYKFVFKNGEPSKTPQTIIDILEFLASPEVNLTRSDALVALGGGVTGDMTGFAAASYLRGISFVQIPTTLLAAVDSSVGGKTGVNLTAGKNLMGAFWQPSLVLFDAETLKTLPDDIYTDGLAEILKCGFIADEALIKYMQEPARDTETMVAEAVSVKKTLVEADEKDTGARQLLNFGHTVGHAIEKCSDYQTSHGQAVATGMHVMTGSAVSAGLCPKNCYDTLKAALETLKLDQKCPYDASRLAEAALGDKKRRGDVISLVIPVTLGECTLKQIPVNKLEAFIKAGLEYTNEH